MRDEDPTRRRVSLPALALVAAVALALLLPRLDHGELRGEEGRRLLPAREMSARGDAVVPTIYGRPYLAKPPGMYWAVAAAGALRGETDAVAARGVSALATLLTACGLLLLGTRLFNGRAGLVAALSFLVAPEVVTKGRLGEIDALFALVLFAAIASWLALRERRSVLARALPAGLFLGLALLTKGPVAALFFVGAPLGLALGRRRARELLSPALGLALLAAVAVAGTWVALLVQRLGSFDSLGVWARELSDQAANDDTYAYQRLEYVLDTALAFAPASLGAIALLLGALRRRGAAPALLADPAFCGVLGAATAGWFLLLWYPGTAPRYALPAAPWIALAFGAQLDASLRAGAWNADRALRHAAAGAGLLGLLAGAGVPLVGARLAPGLELGAPGLATCLVTALVGLGALVLARGARPLPALGAACAVLGLSIFLQQTRFAAISAHKHEHARVAAEVDALVPEDAPLFVVSWSDFNTLSYVERELRWCGPQDPLPLGARVLVPRERAASFGRRRDARWYGSARDARGRALEVWCIEGPAWSRTSSWPARN